jgi:hypothetical protein
VIKFFGKHANGSKARVYVIYVIFTNDIQITSIFTFSTDGEELVNGREVDEVIDHNIQISHEAVWFSGQFGGSFVS